MLTSLSASWPVGESSLNQRGPIILNGTTVILLSERDNRFVETSTAWDGDRPILVAQTFFIDAETILILFMMNSLVCRQRQPLATEDR